MIPSLGGPRAVVMEVTLEMIDPDVSLEGEPSPRPLGSPLVTQAVRSSSTKPETRL